MKVGIVGAGGIGARRARIAAGTPDVIVAAVADILADRARKVAEPLGAAVFTDWRAIVDAPDIDVVIVSASNDLHAAVSVAAMEAGKDVLCEKPLARTPAEARRIHDEAVRTGRTLKTGFNHRHYGSVLKSREIADSGELGAPQEMKASVARVANAANR